MTRITGNLHVSQYSFIVIYLSFLLRLRNVSGKHDVHGSVHHNIYLIEITNKMRCVVEFIIPLFLNCSTCFERYIGHHQELKTVIAASGFRCVCGCRQLQRQVAVTVWQIPDAVDTVVCDPVDVWKYHPKYVEQFPDKINYIILHLVGYILEYSYDARIHER